MQLRSLYLINQILLSNQRLLSQLALIKMKSNLRRQPPKKLHQDGSEAEREA